MRMGSAVRNGSMRVGAAIAAMLAVAGCNCGGEATDTGCPEAGGGSDAAGDGSMPGTDACPPAPCTVAVECPAPMACIGGTCQMPTPASCPPVTGEWVGAMVASFEAGYEPLVAMGPDGVLNVVWFAYLPLDGRYEAHYSRIAGAVATDEVLVSACEEFPITIDATVAGEVLLATVSECAGFVCELAVWTLGEAPPVRETVPSSVEPFFQNDAGQWGSFVRLAGIDYLATDVDGGTQLLYFVDTGTGWMEESFSPRNGWTVDAAPTADGVVVLEGEGELRVATWAPGSSLNVVETTVQPDPYGYGPRLLDGTLGAERVLVDSPMLGGFVYGERSASGWSSELVAFPRPSWWYTPSGTNGDGVPFASLVLSDGSVAVAGTTDIEPAFAPMFDPGSVALAVSIRADNGTWTEAVIHRGGSDGFYRGPPGLGLYEDGCGRLGLAAHLNDVYVMPTTGEIWVYEKH